MEKKSGGTNYITHMHHLDGYTFTALLVSPSFLAFGFLAFWVCVHVQACVCVCIVQAGHWLASWDFVEFPNFPP